MRALPPEDPGAAGPPAGDFLAGDLLGSQMGGPGVGLPTAGHPAGDTVGPGPGYAHSHAADRRFGLEEEREWYQNPWFWSAAGGIAFGVMLILLLVIPRLISN